MVQCPGTYSRYRIGLGKLSDSREGLVVKGELVLESPVAAKAYALLKRGVLKGLSIGYDSVKSRMVDNVRRLSELKLFEISLVTFPILLIFKMLCVCKDFFMASMRPRLLVELSQA